MKAHLDVQNVLLQVLDDGRLTDAMLRGEVTEGDTVVFRYDTEAAKVRWEKRQEGAATRTDEGRASASP